MTRALESCDEMRLCDSPAESGHQNVRGLDAGGWEKMISLGEYHLAGLAEASAWLMNTSAAIP